MMTDGDVARAGQAIRSLVEKHYPAATPIARVNEPCHLLYMLDCIDAYISEGRREKAMRWLGFTQGVMWSRGWATIDDLKGHNRPADETK